jgi:hypothetical protein
VKKHRMSVVSTGGRRLRISPMDHSDISVIFLSLVASW